MGQRLLVAVAFLGLFGSTAGAAFAVSSTGLPLAPGADGTAPLQAETGTIVVRKVYQGGAPTAAEVPAVTIGEASAGTPVTAGSLSTWPSLQVNAGIVRVTEVLPASGWKFSQANVSGTGCLQGSVDESVLTGGIPSIAVLVSVPAGGTCTVEFTNVRVAPAPATPTPTPIESVAGDKTAAATPIAPATGSGGETPIAPVFFLLPFLLLVAGAGLFAAARR